MIKKHRIDGFKNGWFVGKFSPSLLEVDVEVSFQKHLKGEKISTHYHRKGKELTLVIKGKEKINGQIFLEGDLFVIDPFTVAEVEILEDLEVIVVKEFSGEYDKVIVG